MTGVVNVVPVVEAISEHAQLHCFQTYLAPDEPPVNVVGLVSWMVCGPVPFPNGREICGREYVAELSILTPTVPSADGTFVDTSM